MREQTFADKLNSLVSLEVSRGTVRDPEAMSDILEKLTAALGFTSALAAAGDPDKIAHLLEGMTAYLYEVASERAPLAKMIVTAKGWAPPAPGRGDITPMPNPPPTSEAPPLAAMARTRFGCPKGR